MSWHSLPEEQNDFKFFLEIGLLRVDVGSGYLTAVTEYPPLETMAKAIERYEFYSVSLNNHSLVTSLSSLYPVAKKILRLYMAYPVYYSTNILEEELPVFSNLQCLNLNGKNLSIFDVNIFRTSNLCQLFLANCNLTSSQVDQIILNILSDQKENGILDIRGNAQPTNASVDAQKELLAKGWQINV